MGRHLDAQIREQLHDLKDEKERLHFLAKHGFDLTLISAALSAPTYVSGLSDAEVGLLRKNLEEHTDPAILKERDFVVWAMAEVERGYKAAASRLSKSGGGRPGVLAHLAQLPTKGESATRVA